MISYDGFFVLCVFLFILEKAAYLFSIVLPDYFFSIAVCAMYMRRTNEGQRTRRMRRRNSLSCSYAHIRSMLDCIYTFILSFHVCVFSLYRLYLFSLIFFLYCLYHCTINGHKKTNHLNDILLFLSFVNNILIKSIS